MIRLKGYPMNQPGKVQPQTAPRLPATPWNLKRVEHYALIMLNSMAAGGSVGISDSDIDFAIDVAERLAKKLVERGHIQDHE